MAELKPGSRLPLLFFGMLSLLGGVMAGLARLGWEVPGPAMQAAVNVGGAAALVGLAMLTAWYGSEKRGERRPATSGLPAPAATDNG